MARDSKLLTAEGSRAIDYIATRYLGVSVLVLMENAGRAVAEEALKLNLKPGRIKAAVFCGKGNNGADGFVAARHLLARGVKTEVFLAAGSKEVADEARQNLDILIRMKQKIREIKPGDLPGLRRKISAYNLIVDALLGVGLRNRVRGIIADLIPMINNSGAYILSIDIPSGLDATTGEAMGCCIKADRTVTFMAKKKGMVVTKGRRYCGRVVVRDLGVPWEIFSRPKKGGVYAL